MRRFLKTSGIYLIGQLSTRFVSLLLLPLFTTHISPEGYGLFDLGNAVISIAVALVFVEISSAVLRFGLESASEQRLSVVVSTAGASAFVSGILLTFIGVAIGLIFSPAYWPLVVGLGLSSAFSVFFQSVSRVYSLNTLFMTSGVVNSLTAAFINVILILGASMGAEALFIAAMAGNVAQIVLLSVMMRLKRATLSMRNVDLDTLKTMLRYSVPLVGNSVALWCSTGLLRVILAAGAGPEANGYVGIADRFLVVMTIFSAITSLAWQETAYRERGAEERASLYSRALDLYVRALGAGLCLLLPVSYFVLPVLVSPEYSLVGSLLPSYFPVAVFAALGAFLATIFTAEKRTAMLLWSTLANASVSVISLLLTMPHLGVYGFVISSLAGGLVMVVMRFLLARRHLAALDIDYRLLIALLIVYGGACVTYLFGGRLGNGIVLLLTSLFFLILLRRLVGRAFGMFPWGR